MKISMLKRLSPEISLAAVSPQAPGMFSRLLFAQTFWQCCQGHLMRRP